ncbi:hypothetical protein P8452_56064 [Trifolium repens]|nr:hypothetical protein P8452_56064 [Trifolium repens]
MFAFYVHVLFLFLLCVLFLFPCRRRLCVSGFCYSALCGGGGGGGGNTDCRSCFSQLFGVLEVEDGGSGDGGVWVQIQKFIRERERESERAKSQLTHSSHLTIHNNHHSFISNFSNNTYDSEKLKKFCRLIHPCLF